MHPAASDSQLILKATPPRVSKSLLARRRLSSSAQQFVDRAVIIVQAPSGFGKTSLLAQWRREALQDGVVVAWLTLDERDDGSRFANGLAVAMRMASGRNSFGQSYGLRLGPDEDALELLTIWLADVASIAADVLLILDDVHALTDTRVETSLLYLLHNAPSNLKIVMGARKQLALPVADMLAHGQFAAVGVDALRFRLEESIAVLEARFGSRIDSDSCVRLHNLTEGWPLGLQLAISTIEKSQNLSEAIAGFSVRTGDIQRFFVECLVERLPLSLADFLVRVSFVDALNVDLCRAITGLADCAALLKQLQNETPILLGGEGSDWLRIHPLAREFLVERFKLFGIEAQRVAHGRAADWLAENQMFEAAARQALQAGKEKQAYELVARCLYDVLLTGQVSKVSEWVERMPATEIEKTPRLRIAVAWTLAMSERHAEAARLVEPISDDHMADMGDRCESAALCATAAVFADDLDRIEPTLAPWLRSLATCPDPLRTIGVNLLAIRTLFRGLPEQVRYLYRQLPSDNALMIGGYTRGWADWAIGFSYLWQGQVILAADVLKASLTRAEAECGRRSPIAVMLASTLAATLWERDQTSEMVALLADRLDVLERRATPDAMIHGYVSAARIAATGGLERRAFDLLENLDALGEARALPRLRVASLTEQVRMHALRLRAEACSALMVRLESVANEPVCKRLGAVGPLVHLQVGLARAYAAVAKQNWKRVLAELNAISPIAERMQRGRDGIQIRVLRALALKRCGEDGLALFNEAISMAEALGLERILVDTHPDLVDWARRVRSGTDVAVNADLWSAEAVRIGPEPSVARPAAHSRVSPSAMLTPKEREVIQLLAGNLSNKQIALALDVSYETVKWHLKNLFCKFDAGNRKHLLDRARMLGILDAVA